ncbi:MAG TPA: hypothetical protein VKY85_18450 [Candidatus Angelobacter sp.]|nr:hypothetical protein [Candidatus Angelobacter sp.]
MGRIVALLLSILLCLAAYGQSSNPQPPNTPPAPGDSSSKQAQPPSPPTPPDVSMPDPGALPAPQDPRQSAVKRKLEQLVPSCLNVLWGFHTCWSSPPASPPKAPAHPVADPEFAKDMEVGDFYLNQTRNYAGAMMRFRDALEHQPNDPLATFRLAQSLEGLHQADAAREDYAAYLKLEPNGRFAGEAKKALERLQEKNAGRARKDSHLP